jgi:hypothetical protein
MLTTALTEGRGYPNLGEHSSQKRAVDQMGLAQEMSVGSVATAKASKPLMTRPAKKAMSVPV